MSEEDQTAGLLDLANRDLWALRDLLQERLWAPRVLSIDTEGRVNFAEFLQVNVDALVSVQAWHPVHNSMGTDEGWAIEVGHPETGALLTGLKLPTGTPILAVAEMVSALVVLCLDLDGFDQAWLNAA